MAGITYRIRIVKPNLQLEAEGDKAFVLQMIDRFEGSAPAHRATPATGQTQPGPQPPKKELTGKPLSLGEFIRQTGVKRHTEKVLAFGYYLEKHAGATHFTSADINNCYYDAKMESSNTSQMLILNIRSRRIMEVKRKKGEKGRRSYMLTHTGEEFIDKKLSKTQG